MLVIFFVAGWILGYAYAHCVIADEVERLGGFYVGKKTYKVYVVKTEGEN